MYGLAIVVGIICLIVFLAALVVLLIASLDGDLAGVAVAAILVAILSGAGVWWGMSTTMRIDREQCEAAGFEWITGTCYGSNVNVNGR